MRCRALCFFVTGTWLLRDGGRPTDPQYPHSLYSLSKSFTSTAIGLAVAEKRLTVDDPVLKFFPDEAPANPSENLKAMRVRHLLSMNTGHKEDTTRTHIPWTEMTTGLARFLSLPDRVPAWHMVRL